MYICKGLAEHEVTAQGDFEEPPLTLLSQGLSAAAEEAAGEGGGSRRVLQHRNVALTPLLQAAEPLCPKVSARVQFRPSAWDSACPAHMCPSAQQHLAAGSRGACHGSWEGTGGDAHTQASMLLLR